MNVRVRFAVMAVIAVVIVAFAVVRGEGRGPSSSGSPVRTARDPGRAPAELPDAVTYRDHEFDPDVVPSPTASKSQSKLWFANGAWWGLLHEPVSDGLHIYRLRPTDRAGSIRGRSSTNGHRRAATHSPWATGCMCGRRTRARPEDAIRLSQFTFRDGLYRLDIDFPRAEGQRRGICRPRARSARIGCGSPTRSRTGYGSAHRRAMTITGARLSRLRSKGRRWRPTISRRSCRSATRSA